MHGKMLPLGLDQIARVATLLEEGRVNISPELCVQVRLPGTTCGHCVECCPAHAVTLNPSPQIDFDQCTGCGVCSSLCPTGAFVLPKPSDQELLAQTQKRAGAANQIAFTCERVARAPTDANAGRVPVRCVGRLDRSLLLATIAAGATRVSLSCGQCDRCPNRGILDIVAGEVTKANDILSSLGRQETVAIESPSLDTTGPAVAPETSAQLAGSRRQFLESIARGTQRAAVATAAVALEGIVGSGSKAASAPIPEPAGLPTRVPIRRGILLASLKRLARRALGVLQDTDGIAPRIRIAETCTICHACAILCPTGALRETHADDVVGVSYRPALCTGCGLCRDACLRGVLEFAGTVDLIQLIDETEQALITRDKADIPWLATPEQLWRKRLRALNS